VDRSPAKGECPTDGRPVRGGRRTSGASPCPRSSPTSATRRSWPSSRSTWCCTSAPRSGSTAVAGARLRAGRRLRVCRRAPRGTVRTLAGRRRWERVHPADGARRTHVGTGPGDRAAGRGVVGAEPP